MVGFLDGLSNITKDGYKNTMMIFSLGGCGTEWLCSTIQDRNMAQEIRRRHDRHNRHCLLPPVDLMMDHKVIYLYGDPRNATLSLLRRAAIDSNFGPEVCRRLETTQEWPVNKPFTLAAFLDTGIDFFRHHSHINNWQSLMMARPNSALVKYEELPRTLPQLEDWMGTKLDLIPWKERGCKWDMLYPAYRDIITKKHLDAVNLWQRLPPIHLT